MVIMRKFNTIFLFILFCTLLTALIEPTVSYANMFSINKSKESYLSPQLQLQNNIIRDIFNSKNNTETYNPYGDEQAVTRSYDDLNEELFLGKINSHIKILLKQRTDSNIPVRALVIGGGRYTAEGLLYQTLTNNSAKENPNMFQVSSFAKENLSIYNFSDIQFTQGNMDDGLPYENAQFDLVIVGDVVTPYFHDKLKALKEIQRVLSSQGKAFVADFGLIAYDDNLGMYGVKNESVLPQIEISSKNLVEYKGRHVRFDNIIFDKQTNIPDLHLKKFVPIQGIGSIEKYISVYYPPSPPLSRLESSVPSESQINQSI